MKDFWIGFWEYVKSPVGIINIVIVAVVGFLTGWLLNK